jgi:SpoIID/LytB domain protein
VRSGEVRIGITRRGGGYDPVSLPLESYVARVVAGEMSAGAPMAALEALTITVRTFAAANRGRHAAEGFDFCDLTHCQVLGLATAETERAARSTAGLVLREGDHVARVFYSAWCGGHTEAPSHVWAGADDPAYLPARPDPACQNEAGWTSEVAEPQLRRVLEAAGLRGSAVRGFSVASRHPSGRAAMLRVEGMAPDHIDANIFQLAAGRVLGWQVVKSTLFNVRRSGVGFVLSGRGLGHGVGLCVRGAASRAAQGRSRVEILAAYFPGLQVAALSGTDSGAGGAAMSGSEPAIRVLLPEADRERLDEVRSLTRQLARVMSSSLGVSVPREITIQFHSTVEAYTRATGQPWWTSARTKGSQIDLLPLDVLRKRGILELTLRHELVHVLIDPLLRDRPLWVREGLAIVKAGERAAGTTVGRSTRGPNSPAGPRGVACPADADFRAAASPEAWRGVYEAAGGCVARALASGTRWQDLR